MADYTYLQSMRIVLYVASPCTTVSFDGMDVSDSGGWIHLKRGVDRGGSGPIGLCGHHHSLWWDGRLMESQEVLETKSPTMALHVSLNSGAKATLMCLDSVRVPSCARSPYVGSSINIVKINRQRHDKPLKFWAWSFGSIFPRRIGIYVLFFLDSTRLQSSILS
ncbi:hypothetical protein M9H77_07770 [Catharanthus roseus]|uniref:Uncharacterized protein n=1 Tax=Catharanthus roseus TaxID=4058 RepID=A0ACC0BVV9_CATRO|nr:hypothetical protein M9H77_07770 [Catharanthus roseus]